jgi:hypothetical protein
MSSLISEAIIRASRGTAAAWTSADTVLEAGEFAYETDTGFVKMGDGSTAWTSLRYFYGAEDSEVGEIKTFSTYWQDMSF